LGVPAEGKKNAAAPDRRMEAHVTAGREAAAAESGAPDADWLGRVAAEAAGSAGAPTELLGDFLPMLADATRIGRRPHGHELALVAQLGRRAAEEGVPPGRVVDLYLSAAWRMWQQLPASERSRDSEVVRAAATAVLRVIDDAVKAVMEGYQTARRQLIRREEALRHELVEDLLRGDADVAGLVERAEPFGVDLGRSHQVLLATPGGQLADTGRVVQLLERAMLDRFGDRNVLVTAKEGVVVVIGPDAGALPARPAEPRDVAELVHSQLATVDDGAPWRVAEGRAYPGAYGIARSYEEAREALMLADRLQAGTSVVRVRDLLVYRVLVRDRTAITDLVDAVLKPLTRARGGAEPLLETLTAYFDSGEVATEAARRLYLSVRAVTYRLDRVRELTGFDPADPADRFSLHAAVLGARLIGWPESADQPAGLYLDGP
jgi:sugar diacid utilization regulator